MSGACAGIIASAISAVSAPTSSAQCLSRSTSTGPLAWIGEEAMARGSPSTSTEMTRPPPRRTASNTEDCAADGAGSPRPEPPISWTSTSAASMARRISDSHRSAEPSWESSKYSIHGVVAARSRRSRSPTSLLVRS